METTRISATGELALLLEAKDLRIGNILLYKGRLVHVTTLSLDIDDEYQETIGFCDLGKTTGEIADWNRTLVADLKPVKLTAGLLLTLGLIKESEYPIYDVDISGKLHIRLNRDGGAILAYDKHGQRKIEYLHDLQNAYNALTGEELSVNLVQ